MIRRILPFLLLLSSFYSLSFAANRTVSIYPSGSSDPAGDDASYTTMALMEAGEDGDITGTGDTLRVEITASDGNWNTADSTNFSFQGWTCDYSSGEYINIVTLDDGARNTYSAGTWSTSSYRLSTTANADTIAIGVNTDFALVFDGVQLENVGSTSDRKIVYIEDGGLDASGYLEFNACHLRRNNGTGTKDRGLYITESAAGSIFCVNSIFHGVGGNLDDALRIYHATASSIVLDVYNCTIGGWTGSAIETDNKGTITMKNCAVFNNGDDFKDSVDTIDYCASDDGDGTNSVDISPAGDGGEAISWAKTFTDYANGDFRVKDTNSYIYHTGLDQNSDANIPSTDIAGNTRPAGDNPVSIGAFEYVTTPSAAEEPPMQIIINVN